MQQSLSASATWRGAPRPSVGTVLVSEVFGPTLQGEGPYAGQPAAFVRVGSCNLNCTWCDTRYTWDANAFDLAEELHLESTDEVLRAVLEIDATITVITGGEPALQASELSLLARELRAAGRSVHLETSGSVDPGALLDACDVVVVSPKLAHSGVPRQARLRWHVLRTITRSGNSVFKFVVRDPADLSEVDEIVAALKLIESRIWIMPEGNERSEVLERMSRIAQPVIARGWSLSPRLQVLLWPNERRR